MKKAYIIMAVFFMMMTPVSVCQAETVEDGQYTIEVTLSGGSGRATVESPSNLSVANGEMTAEIIWSSSYYDLMIVDGVEYRPTNEDGNSTFEISVSQLDRDIEISAETTAMSAPHMIDYTLHFDSSSLHAAGEMDLAYLFLIGGAVLVLIVVGVTIFVKKKQKRVSEYE